MIELLIGITIGLLVVIAALGSLAFTQVTSTAVGDSARLQQKANSAFRTMGFQLRQAGATEVVFFAGTGRVAFSGQPNTGWNGTGVAITGLDGSGSTPDTLRMSYEDSSNPRDCLGNRPIATVGVRVDNEFFVDTGRLMCRGADGTPQAIVDGVEDFQVTYGIQTTTVLPSPAVPAASGVASAPAVAAATNYQTFTAVTAPFGPPLPVGLLPPPGWSVTVCLQLRGDVRGDLPTGTSTVGCSGTVAGDGYVRRAYRNTFSLRSTLS
ncbi:MAG: PilW family protein [Rhodoferax sp.]|nr:PilW family protein [Rhodoferax sp.]